jgi:type I restriction enzyme S subunit
MSRIISNLQAISNLEKLRDTLLPKLLSGELRIPAAEKLVKEAMA